jgi:hypothetical protein
MSGLPRTKRTVMKPAPTSTNSIGFGTNRVLIDRSFDGCTEMGGITDYCILRTHPALPIFVAIVFGWSSDSDTVAVVTSHHESLQYRLVNPFRVYWLSHGAANSSERGVTNMMSKTNARALWEYLRGECNWLVWDTDTLPKVGGAILWRVLTEKMSEQKDSLILNS